MVEHVAGSYASGPRTTNASSYTEPVDVPLARKRISWGAVIAGVIIILVVQMLLSMLGIGVGASTIDPTGELPSGSTLGIGAGLWWVISALLAVLAGSWVAGRLAGSPDRTDGMLHGLVTWGLATLIVFWILTTTLSSLIGGAFGVVGSALQTAAQGTMTGAAAGVTSGAGSTSDPLAKIEGQLDQILNRVSPETQQTGQQLQSALADHRVRDTIHQVITNPDGITPQNREAAVSALVQYGGMSRPQAEQRLTQWESAYQSAMQQAREAAEASADAVSQAALWSFVALTLGAAIALLGGLLGTPRDLRMATTYRRRA